MHSTRGRVPSAMLRSSVCLLLLVAGCSSGPVTPGFRAGFGRADITPSIPEPWSDANGDGRFSEEDGDTFDDTNKNGAFDALWLAGSFEGRAASTIADSLTATALVVDDGQRRIAMVAIDNFGMVLDDVEDVRSRIPAEWGVDRTLVIATGTHSAPDLVGWWTPMDAAPAARWAYLDQAKQGIVEAIGRAVDALEPARMLLAEIDDSEWSPVVDVRPPHVYDPGLRLLRFVDGADVTIGMVISWSCTPEVMGAQNTDVSPDFVGALRRGLERGGDDQPGLGGMSLFLNGAFGGRLTVGTEAVTGGPGPEESGVIGTRASASHLGEMLALAVLGHPPDWRAAADDPLEARLIRAELRIPLENPGLADLVARGHIRRYMSEDSLLTTEMNMVLLGPVWILTLPGEAFPESVSGPRPLERTEAGRAVLPPFRTAMHGEIDLVVSQANDALGPLIPPGSWIPPDGRIGSATAHGEEGRAASPSNVPLIQRGFIRLMSTITTSRR